MRRIRLITYYIRHRRCWNHRNRLLCQRLPSLQPTARPPPRSLCKEKIKQWLI